MQLRGVSPGIPTERIGVMTEFVLSPSDDHLLLRELAHRVNNEFTSIINAISRAAARSPNPESKTVLNEAVEMLHATPISLTSARVNSRTATCAQECHRAMPMPHKFWCSHRRQFRNHALGMQSNHSYSAISTRKPWSMPRKSPRRKRGYSRPQIEITL